jgi:hypothetical protein
LAQAYVLIECGSSLSLTALAKVLLTKICKLNSQKYVEWLMSAPFDIGGTIFRALGCHNVYEWKEKVASQGLGRTVIECAKQKNYKSISNGCLMRAGNDK